MPRLSGFHHVALTVRDLDASIDWYTSLLGLELAFREEVEGRRSCVMQFPGGSPWFGIVEHNFEDGGFDARRLGLDHVAFDVATMDEMDAWAVALTAAGIDHSGAIEVPPGAILNFKDPDGIALSLFWQRG
jgi:glyoxylase I family protein